MAWQEIKSFFKEPRQFVRNYRDRKLIPDPLLKKRLQKFDLEAGNYEWPMSVGKIPNQEELFGPNYWETRSILTQAVNARVLHPEPAEFRVHQTEAHLIARGSARALHALLYRLEQLDIFPKLVDGTEIPPWETVVDDLKVAAGTSSLLQDLHEPIFHRAMKVSRQEKPVKEEKTDLTTTSSPEGAFDRPDRFMLPPQFSKQAIDNLRAWTPDKLLEKVQDLPRLPETANLPEELTIFANFYIRLYEAIRERRRTEIHDDIDNLVARRLLPQIAEEISRLPDQSRTLYHLASRYANLVKQRSIEELKARFYKPKQE